MLDFAFWAVVAWVVWLGFEEFKGTRQQRKDRERRHMEMETLDGRGGKDKMG